MTTDYEATATKIRKITGETCNVKRDGNRIIFEIGFDFNMPEGAADEAFLLITTEHGYDRIDTCAQSSGGEIIFSAN